jgi:two-component sensor histidine kinase
LENVPLAAYFAQLCESLGASMIHDQKQLSIEVLVDDSVVTLNVSISLSMIVTELVINAPKAAFPEHRHGKIIVSYRSNAPKWTLSVADDGVGILTGAPAKPGMGTSIVQALARQLEGEIVTNDASPGTLVTVAREDAMNSGGDLPLAA